MKSDNRETSAPQIEEKSNTNQKKKKKKKKNAQGVEIRVDATSGYCEEKVPSSDSTAPQPGALADTQALIRDLSASAAAPGGLLEQMAKGEATGLYLKGCLFSHRVNLRNTMRHFPEKYHALFPDISNMTKEETDALAVKAFHEAAAKGSVPAMASLASKLTAGEGVPSNSAKALFWLGKAWERGSVDAKKMILQSAMISKECTAVVDSMEQIRKQIPLEQRARGVSVRSPNLLSYLLTLKWEELQQGKYANTFLFQPALDQVCRAVRVAGVHPSFSVGFGGVPSPMVTTGVLTRPRSLVSYTLPKLAGLVREMPTNLDDAPLERASPIFFTCVHQQRSHGGDGGVSFWCIPCYDQAVVRLKAISTGMYALSSGDVFDGYGQGAVYANVETGDLFYEVFKHYSAVEMKEVVGLLARENRMDVYPALLARDPNVLWPIVLNFRSVRSFLEQLQPNFNWTNLLGEKLPGGRDYLLEISNDTVRSKLSAMFPDQLRGIKNRLVKCSNLVCPVLKEAKDLLLCGRCRNARYHSPECQRLDWAEHKKLCVPGARSETKVDRSTNENADSSGKRTSRFNGE